MSCPFFFFELRTVCVLTNFCVRGKDALKDEDIYRRLRMGIEVLDFESLGRDAWTYETVRKVCDEAGAPHMYTLLTALHPIVRLFYLRVSPRVFS